MRVMENNTVTTEIEARWMDAAERADVDNPIRALLGPRTQSDTLALRISLAHRGLTLTTDHSASSYGIPVAVDESAAMRTDPVSGLPLRRENIELPARVIARWDASELG